MHGKNTKKLPPAEHQSIFSNLATIVALHARLEAASETARAALDVEALLAADVRAEIAALSDACSLPAFLDTQKWH